jgi:hypothetical protein
LLNNHLEGKWDVDLSNGVVVDDMPVFKEIDTVDEHINGEISFMNGELSPVNASSLKGIIAIDSDTIRYNLSHPRYEDEVSDDDIKAILFVLANNVTEAQRYGLPVHTMFRQALHPGIYLTVRGSGKSKFIDAMNMEGPPKTINPELGDELHGPALAVAGRMETMEKIVWKELAADAMGVLTMETIPWNLNPGIHVCLYSLSNAPINAPLTKVSPQVLDRLDLITYPDYYAVSKPRTDLQPLGPTADPALRVFGSNVDVRRNLVLDSIQGKVPPTSELLDQIHQEGGVMGGWRGKYPIDTKIAYLEKYGIDSMFYVDGSGPWIARLQPGQSMHKSYINDDVWGMKEKDRAPVVKEYTYQGVGYAVYSHRDDTPGDGMFEHNLEYLKMVRERDFGESWLNPPLTQYRTEMGTLGPDDSFHAATVRDYMEDAMFRKRPPVETSRSVHDKVGPLIDKVLSGVDSGIVVMVGEAPGELVSKTAPRYPDILFLVSSKKPEQSDDLDFDPKYINFPNVRTMYGLADETIKGLAAITYTEGKTVSDVRLIVSDMGVKNIHDPEIEHRFNSMALSLYDAYKESAAAIPLIMKSYTPSPMEFTRHPEILDMMSTMYLLKPDASGPMNREVYMVHGYDFQESFSLEQLYLRQTDAIVRHSGLDIPTAQKGGGVHTYNDWAIGGNMLSGIGTVYSLPHFSTYLGINFPTREGLNWDPSSRDAAVWKVVVTGSSFFTTQKLDTIAGTISNSARLSGTMIRAAVPEMKDNTLYDLRRIVGSRYLRMNNIPGNVIPADATMDGVRIGGRVHLSYMENNEQMYLSISGHMISEIIYNSLYQSLDFTRFFDILISPHRNKWKYVHHFIKVDGVKVPIGNILAEDLVQQKDYPQPWHNIHEYEIALETAVTIMIIFGLRMPVDALRVIRQNLDRKDVRAAISGESLASAQIRSKIQGLSKRLHIR